MTPLFELKDYFFPTFFYSLNMVEYNEKKRKDPQVVVNAHITNFDDDLWGVSVSIKTPDDMEKDQFPYEFSIQIYGIIASTCPQEVNPLVHKRLLYVNGASLLYSTVRDRLFLFSDHHLVKPYMLPTYRFDPYDVKETDVVEEGTVKKRKKANPQPKGKSKKTKE